MYFWHCCTGWVLWEEGWDSGVGRSSSILPDSMILLEKTLAGKASGKNSAFLFLKISEENEAAERGIQSLRDKLKSA